MQVKNIILGWLNVLWNILLLWGINLDSITKFFSLILIIATLVLTILNINSKLKGKQIK